MDHRDPTGETGLAAGLGTLFKNGFGLAFNRLELASLEFAQARNHFLKLLLVGALGIIAVLFALAYWSVLLVVLAWDSMGWKILLLIALGFSALSYGIFRYAQGLLSAGKLSLPATMDELRKDRDALF